MVVGMVVGMVVCVYVVHGSTCWPQGVRGCWGTESRPPRGGPRCVLRTKKHKFGQLLMKYR